MSKPGQTPTWEPSEADFRLLLDLAQEPIAGVDLEGRCTFCNPALVRMLGLDCEEDVVGTTLHDLVRHSHADGRPMAQEDCPILNAPFGGNRGKGRGEHFHRADGTTLAVDFWSYPLTRGGKPIGAVITFSEHAGGAGHGEGRRAGEIAAAVDLASGIAHEMNTPIQFLGINLGFLRHSFDRLSRLLKAHQNAMRAYPPEVAERLRRVETEMDMDFLEAETPKVLAESMEGLAKVSQIVGAIQELASAGKAAPPPGLDGAVKGEHHER